MDYCSSKNNNKVVENEKNYKFVEGNILSADLLRYLLAEEKIDVIMHFAAQSHVGLFFFSLFLLILIILNYFSLFLNFNYYYYLLLILLFFIIIIIFNIFILFNYLLFFFNIIYYFKYKIK